MSDVERDLRRVDAAAELIRATARPMTAAQRVEGLQALTFRLGQRRRAGRRPAWLALFAAGAMAAGALVFWRTVHRTAPDTGALAYRIDGGEIGDGGYVRVSGADGAVLSFSEGTSMRLLPGARGRLGRVDAHGARFAIEQGEAEVKVTPLPGARWLVDAGPFLITVRGTVFHASWDGASEKLDVAMTKGLVSVTGPVAEGAVAVRAGQRLTVNVQTKEVLLRELDGAPAAKRVTGEAPSEAPAPAAGPSPPAVAATATEPARAAPNSRPRGASSGVAAGTPSGSWAVALNAGDFDGILQDADRRGVDAALARAPATELAALADAARYRRRDELARRALLAERSRFPRSARARDAAFLLGRLEEASSGGEGRALEWYDRYLEEAPLGAYASEALGRKMTATARLEGPRAAREVAATYLRRFPGGSYAATARGLLAAP